jgi:hypothetical protein
MADKMNIEQARHAIRDQRASDIRERKKAERRAEMRERTETILNSKEGGAAFPCSLLNEDGFEVEHHGLSVRDYFAARALSAVLKNGTGCGEEYIACKCYTIADAMLAERAK